ncbi:MAG: hypothetical protein Rpha_1799 [Candidatus Ruthia sp. Apha_13_S6]|nr:hypothetical protein [Candidatus Ruthia sp. Apha_13_S6]
MILKEFYFLKLAEKSRKIDQRSTNAPLKTALYSGLCQV